MKRLTWAKIGRTLAGSFFGLLTVVAFHNCGVLRTQSGKILTSYDDTTTSSSVTSTTRVGSSSTTTSTTLVNSGNLILRWQQAPANPIVFLDRSNVYDSSATAMDENSVTRVWFCGQKDPSTIGDHVIYVERAADGTLSTPVVRLAPQKTTNNLDSNHTCAPDVIKHSNPAINGGQPAYLLYYECAGWKFPSPDSCGQPGQPNCLSKRESGPEICLAVSYDGITFKRYNAEYFSAHGSFVDVADTTVPEVAKDPTPVVAWSEELKTACKVSYDSVNRRHLYSFDSSSPCIDGGFYGTGHPTAVVRKGGEIWLFYYASGLSWNDRAIWLAKSQDGIHFYGHQKTSLSPPAGIDIKFHPIDATADTGVFIASTNFGKGSFAYSFDGLNWHGFGWPVTADYELGFADSTLCTTPGGVAPITNPKGYILSLTNVRFLQGLGRLGPSDGVQEGNPCYDVREAQQRGRTWGLYLLKGNFALENP